MSDFILLMWKPLLACLILTGIHTYLGVHVMERKVIFVDLALAQIAALGVAAGMLLGMKHEGFGTYLISLAATFVGAIVLAMTRTREEKVPHEAIIGIVYAAAAALAVLILNRIPEGDEEIRCMLVGHVLLVSGPELLQMALIYSLVGLFHWYFRKTFFSISSDPEAARRKGIRVRIWDILFYFSFGLVVTSSVPVAGVLLVFSFLIIPAVCATLYVQGVAGRLFFGWIFGALASTFGILLSYGMDLPTGAAVVCVFAALLVVLAVPKSLFRGFLKRI